MTGRIVRSVDFERVLAMAARGRSEHFAVHHLPGLPTPTAKPATQRSKLELSTEDAPSMVTAVDDFSVAPASPPPPNQVWLGLVVPKRHARRSVTRSLFKRQIRAAVGRHAGALAHGLWIVRLRAPFDKRTYPSAASTALGQAVRAELEGLLAGAARRAGVR